MVSVTGYLLGGGLSSFARKYGWAAGHVTAFEVVDATGDPARVTADSDPDLFGGRMLWPMDRAAEVFDAFLTSTAHAPRDRRRLAGARPGQSLTGRNLARPHLILWCGDRHRAG